MGTGTTMDPYWSGTWWGSIKNAPDSWGDLTATQNGNRVTGNYTWDQGKLAGTVSANQFTGTWSEAPSYQPPDDAGDMELTLAPDGQSMNGRWRYGSSGNWRTITWTRTGSSTGTGMRPGIGTGSITIDAVAEIVEVLRARGPNGTWILTLTAYDGTQTVYRNIVKDDLTKTGRATVQVTKTVTKPYTVQESKDVIKPTIVKYRVNLLNLIFQGD